MALPTQTKTRDGRDVCIGSFVLMLKKKERKKDLLNTHYMPGRCEDDMCVWVCGCKT